MQGASAATTRDIYPLAALKAERAHPVVAPKMRIAGDAALWI